MITTIEQKEYYSIDDIKSFGINSRRTIESYLSSLREDPSNKHKLKRGQKNQVQIHRTLIPELSTSTYEKRIDNPPNALVINCDYTLFGGFSPKGCSDTSIHQQVIDEVYDLVSTSSDFVRMVYSFEPNSNHEGKNDGYHSHFCIECEDIFNGDFNEIESLILKRFKEGKCQPFVEYYVNTNNSGVKYVLKDPNSYKALIQKGRRITRR